MGWSTSQKQVRNPLKPRETFFGDQESFFGDYKTFLGLISSFLPMSFQTSHRGVVNFPKTCVKSSKPQGNFFWRLGNFFCRLGNFFGSDQFLPSNEFSNITYGVVNFPKTCAKSSKPQGYFFCRFVVQLRIDVVLTELDPSK